MRRARWKRKNVRRVDLRPRKPPAVGGGKLALPRGNPGRKRVALTEASSPGCLGYPRFPSPLPLHGSSREVERQRKEKQSLSISTSKFPPHRARRTGLLQMSGPASRRQKVGKFCRNRFGRLPPRAEGNCTGARLKRFFSWTVHGPFSFCQEQKENGGWKCPAIIMADIPRPMGRQSCYIMTRSGDEVAAPIVRRNGIVPWRPYRGISSIVNASMMSPAPMKRISWGPWIKHPRRAEPASGKILGFAQTAWTRCRAGPLCGPRGRQESAVQHRA